jgi:hypothetical protein
LAFTRNPLDTSVSPATYTADGSSDLLLVDQQRDIAVDGSDKSDGIIVTTGALASDALYNYNIRGFEGKDTIIIDAALIQDTVVNGNAGDDTMRLGNAGFETNVLFDGDSYFLGGKGNDNITAFDVLGGEINGNIGDDTILVDNRVDAGFFQYVGGGQGNDVINIVGDFNNSIIDGNKGKDTINILGTSAGFFGTQSDTSVNGGEDDDIIRQLGGVNTKGLMLNGDKGNDTLIALGDLASTLTGGEGKDTIVSFADAGEKGTIDGGVGADTAVITGTGAETIIFNQGDSIAATKTALTTVPFTVLSSGTVAYADGVDAISGLTSGTDKIDIDFKASGIVVGNLSQNTATINPDEIVEFQGTFTGGVFTIGSNNAADFDYLYIVGGANLTLGQIFTNNTSSFVMDNDAVNTGLVLSDFA